MRWWGVPDASQNIGLSQYGFSRWCPFTGFPIMDSHSTDTEQASGLLHSEARSEAGRFESGGEGHDCALRIALAVARADIHRPK